MKYKNAIILTGKDILIVFICFFMFMFLSGGGTQNVLAAEDEVTITLDANGGQRTVEHLLQILHGAES